eukprot:CAMPEP_0194546390 /NCGR_PEP_ID=MMETSP0253-20130528/90585_1 /TAXON_ID=2966 /ORGANISM="Noctiluca scintillans" /LENGTH=483 /DNA_ID=CAMNT_0039393477 /DNA_START=551 /DNA_END=2002 /DNA_ORIENTATION=+
MKPDNVSGSSMCDDDPVESCSACAAMPEPEPDCSEGVLSVEARVEYSAIAPGTAQQVFGLVTVRAGSSATGPRQEPRRQPMDVMCVLDVSSSMNGNNIRQVQSAVRFVIEQAAPTDRVGLVTFNDTATRVLRLRKMDAEGKNDANVATLRLFASGGTSIAAGLNMALLGMEQRRQRNTVSAILLLTDGQDGATRRQIGALLRRLPGAGCSLYGFGFGADHDAALMSEIAEGAHTPFTFVEDVSTIRAAFAGTIGGLSSVVAQNLTLDLCTRVPLAAVHTPFQVVKEETRARVTIPDMIAEERRDLVVELTVPVTESGRVVLLEASLRYHDLTTGTEVQSPPVAMSVERRETAQPEMELEPDEEVSAQRERVEVSNALKEAALLSDQGGFDEAQRVLEDTETRMRCKKTKNTDVMFLELSDARTRMKNKSAWQGGGKAEVSDAMHMYSVQRCTNVNMSSSSHVQKASKQMFATKTQTKSIGTST